MKSIDELQFGLWRSKRAIHNIDYRLYDMSSSEEEYVDDLEADSFSMKPRLSAYQKPVPFVAWIPDAVLRRLLSLGMLRLTNIN